MSIDLFAEQSLREPFEDYRKLRDLGPVVRLERPEVYAIGRYSNVKDALQRSAEFISGEGVGFSESFNAGRGKNVIQTDGLLHRRMRAEVARPLTPAQVRELRFQLKEMIQTRIAKLADGAEFDAMSQLASFLPVEAIAHFVGLQPEGRERMLTWAAATFNVIGPDQDAADLASVAELRAYLTGLDASKVRQGSWSAALFKAAESGRLSMSEALAALSAFVVPSLDTTILAKGHLLNNLAANPDQWALLKARPQKIPAAVLEGVRHSSVIRWFSRVAASDARIEDTIIPQGARVMLLYGCANRDERHYADPDKFDIGRHPRDHLAWGAGPHSCAGMHLARVEMEVMLEVLVDRNANLWAGTPVRGANRGLFGFTSLPFRIQ